MNIPTESEAFSRLIDHLRLAEEEAYKLMHLARMNNRNPLADGWFSVGELLKRMIFQVTMLATKGRPN